MKRLASDEKWLLGVCGAVMLVLGGLGALYSRSLSAGTSIPTPLPLPSPNGFDRYVAASRALVPANPPVDAVNDTRLLTPAEAAIAYAPARRRAWIAANANAWKLFDSAKNVPSRHPNLRGVTAPFPAWKSLRELARCQSIRVKDFKSGEQWNAAMNGGLDTMQMGRDVERGAPLIGALVGMAIEHIGELPLEDVPSHLSAPEAKSAARRLETMINGAQPFSQVLGEEKWSGVTLLDQALSAKNSASSGSSVVMTLLIPKSRAISAYASMMDDFVAEADKPKMAQKPVVPPSTALGFLGGGTYATILYPPLERSLFNDARRQSLERLLLLRLALRAYRAQHGVYPAQLSALSPSILTKVPVDPFGKGEALRFQPNGASYIVWSIGPDGVDNGGTSIKIKPGKKRVVVSEDSRGDVVARP